MSIIVTGIVGFFFSLIATSTFNKTILVKNLPKSEAKIVKIVVSPTPASRPEVLGESTTDTDTVTFDINAIFNKPLTINSGVTFDGTSIFSKNIKGVSIDLGSGSITAGNILYTVKPGSGINITDGQNPTITNTGVLSIGGQTGDVSLSLTAGGGISVDGLKVTNNDTGSSQKIFKTVAVSGQTDITAGSNTDILTFASGPGVSITTNSDTKTLTINSNNPNVAAGWSHGTGQLALTNPDDSVGIGTTSPTAKLDVVGNAKISGGLDLLSSGLTNAGAITGATGFTSTGTITFGSMSTGIIHSNVSGVLSSSSVNLNSADVSGVLPTSFGGTGLSFYNPGDLLFASSSSSLARLGLGGDGQILTVSGTHLAWGALPSTTGPCPTCLINNPGSDQIITPSQAAATGLIVKQANGGNVDIFKITDYSGGTSYLRVDSTGNVMLGSGQTTAGVLTVSPGNSDPISISPSGQGAQAFTGTITTADLTAARTWTFPDLTGIVCTSAGNCAGTSSSLGGNGNSNFISKWNGTYSLANSLLYDNGTNVGIGTTAPGTKLDIAGTLNATGATTFGSSLNVGGIASLSSTLNVVGATTLASLGVTGDETVGGTLGVTGGTTIGGNLTVSGTGSHSFMGNVGIGTTSPAYRLHVKSSGTSSYPLVIDASDGSTLASIYETSSGTGQMDLRDAGGTVQALIAAGGVSYFNGGNVGIGTTTPAGLFDVNGKFTVLSGGNVGVGTTTPGATFDIASAVTTTNGQNITLSAITSGNGINITTSGNTLTSGHLLNISSALTNTTFTGSLANIDWSPSGSSQIVNTGDLLKINVGQYGTIGNLLNITNNGSTLFSVSQTGITANLPTNFTSAGDTSMVYDLNFTNPTLSNIRSTASLSIISGEAFNASNLTLQTFNNGQLVLDNPGGVALNQSQNWNLNASVNALNFQTATISSLLSLDTANGRIGVGTTSPTDFLQIAHSGSGGITLVSTDSNSTISVTGNNIARGYLGSVSGKVGVYNTFGVGIQVSGNSDVVAGVGMNPGVSSATGTWEVYNNNATTGITRSWIREGAGQLTNEAFGVYANDGTTPRLVVQNGNVGIGTTTPGYLFDVSGGTGIVGRFSGRVVGADAVSTNEFATLGQISAGAGQYFQRTLGSLAPSNITDALNIGAIASTSATVHLPGTINQNAWFSLGTGNVGIGTTAPGAALHTATALSSQKGLIVQGAVSQSASLQEWQNNYGNTLTTIQSNGSLYLAGYSSTPAYGNNALSSGNRTALITVTTTVSSNGGPVTQLVDGNRGGNGFYFNNFTVDSSRWINFDFGSPQIINEATFYQYNAISHGVWKWQGSSDNSTFYDIGSSFTLGNGAITSVETTLNGNTTAYRYYRIIGISGSASSAGYQDEFEFSVITGAGNITTQSLLTSSSLGIGTTAPTATLDIRGNANISTYATVGASLAVGYASTPAGVGNAVFSGNVGIGITAPTAKLDINGNLNIATYATVGASLTVNNAITANSLALAGTNVTTTNVEAISASTLSSGTLLNLAHQGTYTSVTGVSGNVLSASRNLTANIVGGGVQPDNNKYIDWVSGNITSSFTVGSGANRYLLVGVANITASSVSSMTYAGAAMTLVGVTEANNYRAEFWGLKNPTSGANNLVINFIGTSADAVSISSWTGVDQTTPTGTYTAASGSSGPFTVTVPSAANEVVVDFFRGHFGTGTPAGGQTAVSTNMSSKPGATSTVMTWTVNWGDYWVLQGVPLKPSGSNPVTISGDLASLSSTCAATSGSCIDTANILKLNQQFAGSIGSVLSILGAGTGNIATMSATNTSANGLSILLGSSSSSQYGLSVASNNGATTGLYVRADGSVGIGTNSPTGKFTVSGSTTGKSLVVLNETGDQALLTASASGTTKFTINHNGLVNATAGGIATFTKAGTISDSDFADTPVDGMTAYDTTNHRLYYREGGAWSYIAKTGGFQIPASESSGLSSGDFLMPYVETTMSDGAVHGLYSKFSDVKKLLFVDEQTQIESIIARISALEKQGAVTSSPVDFQANATFRAFVEFFDSVVFHGRATFEKAPLFSGNTAGTAIISSYSDEVKVLFDQKYDATPIVNFTLVNEATDSSFLEEGQKAYLTKVSPEGFTIKLPILAIRDYTYNWMAIATNSTKVTKSVSPLQGILGQIAGAATGSAGITSLATPSADLSPTPVATVSAGL